MARKRKEKKLTKLQLRKLMKTWSLDNNICPKCHKQFYLDTQGGMGWAICEKCNTEYKIQQINGDWKMVKKWH